MVRYDGGGGDTEQMMAEELVCLLAPEAAL